MASGAGSLGPAAITKLTRELMALQSKPLEGIKICMNEENVADVQAEIQGPTATPYEGGVFRMKLILGNDFPATAPKGASRLKSRCVASRCWRIGLARRESPGCLVHSDLSQTRDKGGQRVPECCHSSPYSIFSLLAPVRSVGRCSRDTRPRPRPLKRVCTRTEMCTITQATSSRRFSTRTSQ